MIRPNVYGPVDSASCQVAHGHASGGTGVAIFTRLRSARWRMVGRPCGQFHGLLRPVRLFRIRYICGLSSARPIMMEPRHARIASMARTWRRPTKRVRMGPNLDDGSRVDPDAGLSIGRPRPIVAVGGAEKRLPNNDRFRSSMRAVDQTRPGA
eukprot:8798815-Pyramimonas_sp.AAC.1